MVSFDFNKTHLRLYGELLARGIRYTYCVGCEPDKYAHKIDVARMVASLQAKVDRKLADECVCMIQHCPPGRCHG